MNKAQVPDLRELYTYKLPLGHRGWSGFSLFFWILSPMDESACSLCHWGQFVAPYIPYSETVSSVFKTHFISFRSANAVPFQNLVQRVSIHTNGGSLHSLDNHAMLTISLGILLYPCLSSSLYLSLLSFIFVSFVGNRSVFVANSKGTMKIKERKQ